MPWPSLLKMKKSIGKTCMGCLKHNFADARAGEQRVRMHGIVLVTCVMHAFWSTHEPFDFLGRQPIAHSVGNERRKSLHQSVPENQRSSASI